MDWLKSKFSRTPPSHSYKPFESHTTSTGSGQVTGDTGGYVKVEGPSLNRGVGGDYVGGSYSLFGVKFGVPVNHDTTIGGGIGLKTGGGGVGRSKDHLGGDTTTVDIPLTPFSLFKTSYPPNTSQWSRKSSQEDQSHTQRLRREGIELEIQDIQKKRGMMSDSDYERQMNFFKRKYDDS